jgi:hypothetical protein
MRSENAHKRFAAASLDLSERGKNSADKSRVLIVAEAWLDLAEQTTQLVGGETGEAREIIEQPLSCIASARFTS